MIEKKLDGNSGKLNVGEIEYLLTLSEKNKEELKAKITLDFGAIDKFIDVLDKEVNGYISSSRKRSETDKNYILGLRDQIKKKLSITGVSKETVQIKNVIREIEKKVKDDDSKNLKGEKITKEVKTEKPINKQLYPAKILPSNEITKEVKTEKTDTERKGKFDENLDQKLNPVNHLFFHKTSTQEIIVVEVTTDKKKEISSAIKNIENHYKDNKIDAVANVEIYLDNLSKNLNYKNKVYTVSQAYENASKDTNVTQAIIGDKSKGSDYNLLASYNKDIKVIEVDAGSRIGDAILNPFVKLVTLGQYKVQTANVTEENLGGSSRKATGQDFYEGATRVTQNSQGGSTSETLMKPLKNYEGGEAITQDYTNKIKNILQKTFGKGYMGRTEKTIEKLKKSIKYEEQLAGLYLDNNAIENLYDENLSNSIKSWLQNKFSKETPQLYSIDQSGHVIFNEKNTDNKNTNGFAKMSIDTDTGNKEVILPRQFIGFQPLGIDGKGLKNISTMKPIVIEKAGIFMQITGNGVYTIGDLAASGYTSSADFIKKHETASAALVAGIIGGIIGRGGVDLSEIGTAFENLGQAIRSESTHVADEANRFFDKLHVDIDLSQFDKFGWGALLGYLMTAIPYEYQVGKLTEDKARANADRGGADALAGEFNIDNISKVDLIDDIKNIYGNKFDKNHTFKVFTGLNSGDIGKSYNELRNNAGHALMKQSGLFGLGEALSLNIHNILYDNSGINMIITGDALRAKEGGNIVIDGKKFLIKDGNSLKIQFNDKGDVTSIEGTLYKDKFIGSKKIEIKVNNINAFREQLVSA